jgi:hypothetical protein
MGFEVLAPVLIKSSSSVEPSGSVQCLRSLGDRDRGFESHSGHGCVVFVCVRLSVFVYR